MPKYPINFNEQEKDRLDQQGLFLKDPQLELLGKSAKRCLEIGCGVGSNIKTLRSLNPELFYHGIDICSKVLDKASKLYGDCNTNFDQAEGDKFKSNEKFDLIVIRLVLWGTDNKEEILKNAYHLLNSSGRIYCYEPDDQYLIIYPEKTNFMNIIRNWQKKFGPQVATHLLAEN